MSWSISIEVGSKDVTEILVASQAKAEEFFASYTGEGIEEMREQVAAAAGAAAALLDVVGTKGPWRVNLYGHANPGHRTKAGWTNDTTNVQVQEL